MFKITEETKAEAVEAMRAIFAKGVSLQYLHGLQAAAECHPVLALLLHSLIGVDLHFRNFFLGVPAIGLHHIADLVFHHGGVGLETDVLCKTCR